MHRFFPLNIVGRREESSTAISIAIDVPMRWRPHFRFQPGQYLTLRTRIGDRDVRRAYSICSGQDETELRVAIKRVENGLFSNHACDTFAEGQPIDVMPPHGRFTLPQAESPSRHIVGCAAGSGITPILSIMKSVLAREPSSRFTLFYGNRSPDEVLFRDELHELSIEYVDRLAVRHVHSRRADGTSPLGRLCDHLPELLARNIAAPHEVQRWFVCGPDEMMASAASIIASLGVAPDRILSERFGGSAVDSAPEGTDPAAVVTATIMGREVTFSPGTATIADGALEAGIDFPYSCGIGVCAMCKARVVEGKAQMVGDTILTPEEQAGGEILTCCAYAMSPTLKIDCDD